MKDYCVKRVLLYSSCLKPESSKVWGCLGLRSCREHLSSLLVFQAPGRGWCLGLGVLGGRRVLRV